jgi:hypothetical protein
MITALVIVIGIALGTIEIVVRHFESLIRRERLDAERLVEKSYVNGIEEGRRRERLGVRTNKIDENYSLVARARAQ